MVATAAAEGNARMATARAAEQSAAQAARTKHIGKAFDPMDGYTDNNIDRNRELVRAGYAKDGEEMPDLNQHDIDRLSRNKKKYEKLGEDGTDLKFEAWLQLMLAGIQYQDPMNPKDPSDTAVDMATFAQVQAMNDLKDGVNGINGKMDNLNAASVSNRLGKTIEVESTAFYHDAQDSKKIGYTLPMGAKTVEFTVLDANHQEVRQWRLEDGDRIKVNGKDEIIDLKLGRNDAYWDGTHQNALPAEAGKYTIQVKAFDAEGKRIKNPDTGQALPIPTYFEGTLDSSYRDTKGVYKITVDGVELDMGAITKSTKPAQQTRGAANGTTGAAEAIQEEEEDRGPKLPPEQQAKWDAARTRLFKHYDAEGVTMDKIQDDMEARLNRLNLDRPWSGLAKPGDA